MNISNFAPWQSFIGGILIGVASIMLMLYNGRIAGISGIGKGLILKIKLEEKLWRIYFLSGLLAGGLIITILFPEQTAKINDISLTKAILGGLLVGIGTAFSNGCTSGHGVCGIGRKSPRSIMATLAFMFSGFITVYTVFHIMGV